MTWEGKKVEKTIGFAFALDWITGPLLAPPLPLLLPVLPLLLLLPPPRPLRPIWFSVGERIWESKNVEKTISFDWFTTNRATATIQYYTTSTSTSTKCYYHHQEHQHWYQYGIHWEKGLGREEQEEEENFQEGTNAARTAISLLLTVHSCLSEEE